MVTFTEEIRNGKLSLCSDTKILHSLMKRKTYKKCHSFFQEIQVSPVEFRRFWGQHGKNLHKDMLYTIGKIRVSGPAGSIL